MRQMRRIQNFNTRGESSWMLIKPLNPESTPEFK